MGNPRSVGYCYVTLVTKRLRLINVSVKLVTLGDSPHARRITTCRTRLLITGA